MTDGNIVKLNAPRRFEERLPCELRFNNGVLEQKWKVIRGREGELTQAAVTEEWVQVPST